MSQSSRRQHDEYRRRLAERIKNGEESKDYGEGKPSSSAKQSRTFLSLFWQFLRIAHNQRWRIAFALCTLTLATSCRLVPPAATKFAIDYVIGSNPVPQFWTNLGLPSDRFAILYTLCGIVTAFSVLATTLHVSGRWQATKAVQRLQVGLRKRVFEHTLHLPLHRVYAMKSGGAASLLREDAGGIADLVFSMLYNPWQALIQLLGSLIVLLFVDWRLLLGGLLLAPAIYLTHRTWIARLRPMHRDIRAQRQHLDSQSTEAFGGMRVVRTFGRQKNESARFVRGSHLMSRQQLAAWWWARVIEIVWDLLIPLASIALLLYGGFSVMQGKLTLGDLTMFLFYLTMLLGPMATLLETATALQSNLAGLERVLDLFDESPEMAPTPNSRPFPKGGIQSGIVLENVGFQYPGSRQPVLKNINLNVRAGETIAFVGPSGAGKTTLCNLIARFYDPTSGVIRVDGVDLRDYEVESYRRLLGIVEQDVFLFDGTIGENIAYGRRRADRAAIEHAAQLAHAHEFITSFTDGYDTKIGERGVKLSGGQRQRLALARAILANPQILILDEATSNLDSESERLIQQSLEQFLPGRTNIVIAHRLSTVMNASRIVVVEQGEIRDVGPHLELIERSDRYRRMVELQTAVQGTVLEPTS
jgi:ATP-binding cassette subfamily B protein